MYRDNESPARAYRDDGLVKEAECAVDADFEVLKDILANVRDSWRFQRDTRIAFKHAQQQYAEAQQNHRHWLEEYDKFMKLMGEADAES